MRALLDRGVMNLFDINHMERERSRRLRATKFAVSLARFKFRDDRSCSSEELLLNSIP